MGIPKEVIKRQRILKVIIDEMIGRRISNLESV